MKKLTVLAAGLLLLIPTLSFADSISLRVGYFMPRALSNSYLGLHPDSLWTIELDQMSFAPKDYRGGMIGLSYDRFIGPNLSAALTVGGDNKSQVGFYTQWVLNTLHAGE